MLGQGKVTLWNISIRLAACTSSGRHLLNCNGPSYTRYFTSREQAAARRRVQLGCPHSLNGINKPPSGAAEVGTCGGQIYTIVQGHAGGGVVNAQPPGPRRLAWYPTEKVSRPVVECLQTREPVTLDPGTTNPSRMNRQRSSVSPSSTTGFVGHRIQLPEPHPPTIRQPFLPKSSGNSGPG